MKNQKNTYLKKYSHEFLKILRDSFNQIKIEKCVYLVKHIKKKKKKNYNYW